MYTRIFTSMNNEIQIYSFLFNKLALSPMASAMIAVHRDRIVLASYAPWPEIQPLMPRDQIVSSDFPLPTDTAKL